MIRTLVCLTAATLSLALSGAATPASAHPPKPVPFPHVPPVIVERPAPPVFVPPHRPVCRAWKVQYRTCHHEPWQCAGVFKEYDDARCVARDLRRQGFRTDIDYVRH